MSTPRTTRSKSRDSHAPITARGSGGEVPALPPKTSNAYGGTGRLVLPTGLSADTAIADLTAVFDQQRGAATVEQEAINSEGAGTVKAKGRGKRAATSRKSPSVRSRATSRASSKAAAPLTPIDESREELSAESLRRHQREASAQLVGSTHEDETGADSDEEATVKTNSEDLEEKDNGEAKGGPSGGNANQQNSTAKASRSAPTTQYSSFTHEKQSAQPMQSNQGGARQPPGGWERLVRAFQTLNRPLFQYWHIPVYLICLSLALAAMVAAMVQLSRLASETYHTFSTWNAEHYHNSTLRHISNIDGKVTHLATEIATVEKTNSRFEQSIADLQKVLPNALIVDKQADGSYKIPEYFWQALKDRDDAPTWERFVAKNKVELDSYVSAHSENNLQTALDTKRLVSSQVFTDMLNSNYEQMQANLKQLSEDIHDKISRIYAESSKHAREVFEERFRHGSNAELNLLGAANLIRNAENALRSVNFFSANLGAVVDPTLSSPTARKPTNGLGQWFYNTFGLGPRGANPPIAALERWDEAGDCWCAAQPPTPETTVKAFDPPKPAPSSPAKAQLAVLMPFVIYPTTVTVEHIPSQGTLDITAAPKEMELWISVLNGTALNLVAQRAVDNKLVDAIQDAIDSTSGAPYELDATFVLAARWTYDIYALNHVQTFDIPVDLAEYHVGTNKAAIRAKTNYGGNHTCFYRVRVSGLVKTIEDEKIRVAAEAKAEYSRSSSAVRASETSRWKEEARATERWW